MSSYPEIFVGMWLLPVVLFILFPLAMFGVWSIAQTLKKILFSVEKVEKAVRENYESNGSEIQQPSVAN